MGFKNMYRCRFLNQVIKQLKDSDYDYIIVQNRPQFILKLKKHLKNSSKIILHLHNKHIFTNSFSSSLNEQIYDGFDGILGVSDFIREQVFLHAPRMCANKVKTLQNMVDTEKFKSMAVEKIAVYEKLANKNVVSFHGRLIPEKGVLEMIIAYKIAAKSISNLALLIIGKLNNTSYCERLKEEMNKDIIFVDGISHSEIEKYLSIADLSVAPSLCDEASGLAHLESLAMGKPLITTTGGGPEEFIEHRKTGFLVDVTPNFEESLAAQIIDCFEDRELMLKIGDNAREFVVKNRSLDQYLENLVFTLNLFGRRS
ncbi:glycosyltransferase family 4 protein [Listeria rocourtiae]|uniref:glycosyltransferase family 4 protein n=1 Tax=Listeria rocourtiae TaxID=647910 RepID=UPI003D2F5B96